MLIVRVVIFHEAAAGTVEERVHNSFDFDLYSLGQTGRTSSLLGQRK